MGTPNSPVERFYIIYSINPLKKTYEAATGRSEASEGVLNIHKQAQDARDFSRE